MLLIPSSKKKKLVKFTREKKNAKKNSQFFMVEKVSKFVEKEIIATNEGRKEGENCGHKSHSLYFLTLRNLVI